MFLSSVAEVEGLQDQYMDSMASVKAKIIERFASVEWQGRNVIINEPAAAEDISNMKSVLSVICSDDVDVSTIKDLRKCEQLRKFVDDHCQIRHYCFQVGTV